MANIITTGLSTYVSENQFALLNDIILGSDIVKKFSVQTGVKTSARIHYLATNPSWQDGSECGFNADGTAELTEREIVTGAIKINLTFCNENLLAKYAQDRVRLVGTDESFGFEAEVVASIIGHIKEDLEKAIFYGDKASGDAKLNKFDGLKKILTNEAGSVKVTVAASDSAYDAIQKVYMALPEEALNKGAEILVSPSIYRSFLQELVAKNLYHYAGPQDAAPNEYVLPGTDVRVVKETGLSGKDMIAGHLADVFYGCDIEGASEEIKLWFSDDDDLWKMKVLWNSGVQCAWPNQMVIAAAE